MTPFTLPPDYPRIQRVNSFQELVTTPFADCVNALCWQRTLPGDFSEVAAERESIAAERTEQLDRHLTHT